MLGIKLLVRVGATEGELDSKGVGLALVNVLGSKLEFSDGITDDASGSIEVGL